MFKKILDYYSYKIDDMPRRKLNVDGEELLSWLKMTAVLIIALAILPMFISFYFDYVKWWIVK